MDPRRLEPSLRKARPEREWEDFPGFGTELGEFDPEVYSQDPLSEDLDFEIADPGDTP